MDTFKISVSKTPKNNIPVFSVYTNRGKEFLFNFLRSNTDDKVWYFNIPENQVRVHFVTSDEFPVQHLLEYAKAVITLRYGIIDFQVQMTVEAKRLLGVK